MSYLVENGCLSKVGQLSIATREFSKALIVTDDNVAKTPHLQTLRESLSSVGIDNGCFVIPHGEDGKSQRVLNEGWQACQEFDLGRNAIVALGGGVVGDLAGFMASTYRRGTLLYMVPTSLLAMVDAHIGGKNG